MRVLARYYQFYLGTWYNLLDLVWRLKFVSRKFLRTRHRLLIRNNLDRRVVTLVFYDRYLVTERCYLVDSQENRE